MSSLYRTPFTGYYGMWSAVSKRFVFGIQERSPRKAINKLWERIGWNAAKYRFSAKRIRDCDNHREMFYRGLKQMQKARSGKRTQNKTLKSNITQKGRDSSMNIKITVEAPGLVSAIESLALALSGAGLPSFSPDVAGAVTKEETETAIDTSKAEQDALAAEKAEAAKKKAIQDAAAKKAEAEKAAELAAIEAKRLADEAAAKEAAAKDVEETETSDPGISLEVVRGKLAALSALGKPQQLQIQDAITRFGVEKLTDVNPEDYAELLELSGVKA